VRFRAEGFDERVFQRKVEERKTSTVTRGGSKPKWGVGGGVAEKWNEVLGETVQFHLADAPPSLGIELWNADPAGDTLIGLHLLETGSGAMPIKDKRDRWDSGEVWCDLHHPKTGKSAGKVRVSVSWRERPEEKKFSEESLRVERASQTVHLLQDQYAHGGGCLTRTVLYTPGDVTSLVTEADLRFRRRITLYRQVSALEPGQEQADGAMQERVRFEQTERWVQVTHDVDQASGGSMSKSLWQKWIGSEETAELRRSKPPPVAEGPPTLLVQVKTERDLQAVVGTGEALWAMDAVTTSGARTSLGTEAAATRMQAAMRGRRARKQAVRELDEIKAMQALVRGRAARTAVGRRRRQKTTLSAEAQLRASQEAFDEQVRMVNEMVAGMRNLVTDIHSQADKNEDSLRGTAGWALFSKAQDEAAGALLEAFRKELDECVLASEMEAALGRYQADSMAKEEAVTEALARIEAGKKAEADALEELRSRVASLVDEMDELVRETEAMEKDGWRKRREPMQVLLWRAQQAIDEAKESKLVPEDALAEARERRERVYKEEQARIVVEEAEKLAGEQCLDAAFAQTMLFMFSPSKSGSLADGMTAADRRRQSEESAAEARRRAEKTWRGSFVRALTLKATTWTVLTVCSACLVRSQYLGTAGAHLPSLFSELLFRPR